jgi:23S rRNA (pseudouridine1915-N3)-methyltransferase
MKVALLCVGRPRGAVVPVIEEYERRASRYFRYDVIEVKETPRRGQAVDLVLKDEADRLLARVPPQTELVALHRPGKSWSSETLARHLAEAALRSSTGITFVIGGAFGLHHDVLDRANTHLSLSGMTLPHDLARLVLIEQIYRAGTIARGEPYHKGIGG